MTYGRIETIADLPPAGPLNDRAREKADLDFKNHELGLPRLGDNGACQD